MCNQCFGDTNNACKHDCLQTGKKLDIIMPMIPQKNICIIIVCVRRHIALARPNITHTFIVINKEVFYLICIPNTFCTVLYNHSFPTILLFPLKMLSESSFRRRSNTNFYIFIVTMVLTDATN